MPPRQASRQASRKRSPAWAVALLALVIYASAATVVVVLDLRVPLPAPWWAAAVPPVVYAVVAVIAIRRRSVARVLAAIGALCAAHGLLLAGTAAVVAHVTPAAPAPFSSGPLGVLTLVCVPFVLAPLRPREVVRARHSRGAVGNAPQTPGLAQRRASGPAPPSAPSPPIRPAAPPRPWPAPTPRPAQPAPAAGRPTSTPPASPVFAPPLRPAPAAPPPPPASPEPPAHMVSPPPPPPSPKPLEPALPLTSVSTSRGAEPMEEVIRIPFARVADQLPAEIFTLPREGVGAHLLEADHLLIPERLVRPQLAEGLVQVGWPIVAEQFPRESLALPDEEIVRRLPDGALVLPLDEVVRQVPPGIFAVPAPTLDVAALEEFPPPFQPYLPTPTSLDPNAPSPVANEAPGPLAPAVEPPPIAAEAAAPAPAYEPQLLAYEPEPPAYEPQPLAYETQPLAYESEPPAYEPQPPAYEPQPLAYESQPLAPEPSPAELEPESAVPGLELPDPEPAPSAWEMEPQAFEPPLPAPELTPPAPALPPSDDFSRASDARRMAALLGPLLSPVTVDRCERPGATFLTLAPPALAGPMVADVAARLLPFLTDARLPEPALQATVRGTAMTVVITPLAGAPNSALAAATTAGASLALLERLCLRAAAVPVAHGRPSTSVPASASGGEFQETAPEPTVRAVAESLQAFGPVTPTVLRDPDGALVVYLFLPRGLAPRTLGGFARDVHRALAGSPAGTLASVILRVGTRRLLLRAVEGTRGPVLVAGGGPVDRPGMARLELERAATRLGQL